MYKPIVIDTYMNDYGYWVVVISVAPGRRMPVMICQQGITPEQAVDLAFTASAAITR